jgi:DNA polymerase IV
MFVQCAIMADPNRLAGESLILVGGRPEGRGVVASASYGCRAFGVRSAMPMATALRLCPDAIVVPAPGPMIRMKSRELATILERWAPLASMASVDEAYLDLTGTEALYHRATLAEVARRIQEEVLEATGLDVSIGGGTNRFVAKLATSFAKPAGVFVVPPGEEEAFVAKLEITDLTGVGPALVEDLRRRGVVTMGALRALEVATMASWWGEDRARWLWRRARGIDDSPVTSGDPAKSVSSERTFARDIDQTTELERALLAEVVDAGAALRRKALFARTITVRVRDADFRDRSRARTLSEPVQSDRVIYRIARQLLRDLRSQRFTPARLIGVSLSNLTGQGRAEQATLGDVAPPEEADRDRALSRAVDTIRSRHGDVIRPGALPPHRRPE